MKLKIIAVIYLCITIVVAVFAFTGSGEGRTPKEMTGADILEMAQNVTMDTFEFHYEAGMEAMGDASLNYLTGAIDVPNRQIYTVSTSSLWPGYIEEVYIVDGWLYLFDSDWSSEWIRTELTDDIWAQQDVHSQYIAFLHGDKDSEYIGMEKIGGADCYKISVAMDLATLIEALGGDMDDVTEQEMQEMADMIKELSCFAWIAENTYYPLKVSFDMTMEADFFGTMITMVMSLDMTASNINQPANITLPAEAQDARTITYEQFMWGYW